MTKNKYKKKKQKKKQENFKKKLKENISLIATIITIISAFITMIYNYYEKTSETYFNFIYFSTKIVTINDNIEYNYGYYNDMINYPTLNNEINDLIKSGEYNDYYVIYLILTEVGDYAAKDSVIKLLNVSENKYLTFDVDFNIVKNQGIKIPIAICNMEYDKPTDYLFKEFSFADCSLSYYKPISISYHNRFLFSNRTVKIRPLNSYNFVIDGEAVAGIGDVNYPNSNKKWYLKK